MINFNNTSSVQQFQVNENQDLNRKEKKQLKRLNKLSQKLDQLPQDNERKQSLLNKINNLINKLENSGVISTNTTPAKPVMPPIIMDGPAPITPPIGIIQDGPAPIIETKPMPMPEVSVNPFPNPEPEISVNPFPTSMPAPQPLPEPPIGMIQDGPAPIIDPQPPIGIIQDGPAPIIEPRPMPIGAIQDGPAPIMEPVIMDGPAPITQPIGIIQDGPAPTTPNVNQQPTLIGDPSDLSTPLLNDTQWIGQISQLFRNSDNLHFAADAGIATSVQNADPQALKDAVIEQLDLGNYDLAFNLFEALGDPVYARNRSSIPAAHLNDFLNFLKANVSGEELKNAMTNNLPQNDSNPFFNNPMIQPR